MRTFCEVITYRSAATSACWCRISRARSLACARRRGGFKARAKRCLDGSDVAIVHPQELLARPAAVLLVAGLARGAHERIGATVEVARRTAAPPLWVVGHGTRTELGIRKRRTAYGHGPRRPPGGPRLALDALNRMTIPAQYFSNQSLVNRPA